MVKVKVGFMRKVSDVSYLLGSKSNRVANITEKIVLSDADYNHFEKNLLEDFAWLKGKGGETIQVENHSGTKRLIVETEGYDYARYVSLVHGEVED